MVLPRDDAPHDRLTEWWYYTGHLRAGDGSRYGFEYVIFRAERGRFPVSWVSHLAITDETGDRFLYDQRLEVGDAGRSLRRRTGSTWRSPVRTRRTRRPRRPRRRLDDGRLRRPRSPRRGQLHGRARARPHARRHEARGPPRSRRLDRLRARRRLVLLLADRDDRHGHADRRRRAGPGRGRGLVRSPVGRLHLGRWRWLGLVRGQPRGRHRHHAVPRPRGRRHVPAGLRDGRRLRTARPATSTATRSASR